MHMLRSRSRFWIVLIAFAALFAPSVAGAQRGDRADARDIPKQITMRLISLQVASVSFDRVELRARVTITPQASAVLSNIAFASMWLDGRAPIFLVPLHGSFILHAGEETELPPIPVLVYFDDLASMEPLRRILDARSTHLTGEARANLSVSLLDKLVLRSKHPVAVSILDQDVEVLPSSVPLAATLAIHGAALGESVSHTVQNLLNIRVQRTEARPWATSLLCVHTSYRIRSGDNTLTESVDRLGFWVAPHVAALPDEALRPWAYSATVAERLARTGGKVDEADVEITVRPLESDARPWKLSQRDFSIEPGGRRVSERVVLPSRPHGIELQRRDSGGNVALLRFRDEISGVPIPLITHDASTDQAVVYRLATTGADEPSTVSTLSLAVTVNGGDVHLERPVSSNAFGSPVLLKNGAVGMVQTEDGVTDIAALLEVRHVR